jgi:hypothetical protein
MQRMNIARHSIAHALSSCCYHQQVEASAHQALSMRMNPDWHSLCWANIAAIAGLPQEGVPALSRD